MRVFAAVVACFPCMTLADDMPKLDDARIVAILTDQKLRYSDGWQEFFASGRTLYNAGRDSWGYWRAQGGQYCSRWPPADVWACYDVYAAGDAVRFVGAGGTPTDGTIVPK